MKNRRLSSLFGTCVLFLAILACTITVGGPEYPDQQIAVSTEAAGQIQFVLQTAEAAGTTSGQITVVLTETQLTSYLFYRLAVQTQPLFTDPQVYLQNGQIQIFGTARKGYFQATVAIILTAGVNDQGQLEIELTSADFGPLPVPGGLKDAITAAIQEMYTGAIGPAAIGFRLKSISIADGLMTITGITK
jgi:uncharacterized protein YpmS